MRPQGRPPIRGSSWVADGADRCRSEVTSPTHTLSPPPTLQATRVITLYQVPRDLSLFFFFLPAPFSFVINKHTYSCYLLVLSGLGTLLNGQCDLLGKHIMTNKAICSSVSVGEDLFMENMAIYPYITQRTFFKFINNQQNWFQNRVLVGNSPG